MWRLVHSSIVLREHLAFLRRAGLLSLNNDVRKKQEVATDSPEDPENGTEQEMAALELQAKPKPGREQPDMGLVFLRWFRLLVCHLTALETLSLFLPAQHY